MLEKGYYLASKISPLQPFFILIFRIKIDTKLIVISLKLFIFPLKINCSESERLLFKLFIHELAKQNEPTKTMRGVAQPVRPYVCSLKVTSSSLTNLRVTKGLHGR